MRRQMSWPAGLLGVWWLLAPLVPAPEALAADAGAGASLAQQQTPPAQVPVIQSWTADRRHYVVGDVITILINESTLASANLSYVASQDNSRRSGVSASNNVGLGPTVEGTFRTTNVGSTRDRGESVRRDRLTTEITAVVLEVESNGVLRVEGKRQLTIDDHRQEFSISGRVRPQDVMPHNVVESRRVADAKIGYEAQGRLGKARGGIISRLIGWLWP